jgi:hypothetical protein
LYEQHSIVAGQITGIELFRAEISQAALDAERRQTISYSISTLLTRNRHDVFGENDPARRRTAIYEIFTEDCVFYEPRGVYRGRTSSPLRRNDCANCLRPWSRR